MTDFQGLFFFNDNFIKESSELFQRESWNSEWQKEASIIQTTVKKNLPFVCFQLKRKSSAS
jgi:hypothetical protein